ncbi:MAG: hypothetical protein FWB94_07565 [Chitinispirillia bacterium]|nr:hypothetical protein [Chitinispirillia bacterium]
MAVGLVGGALAGILTNTLCGGFIATLLNIDASLEKMAGKAGNAVNINAKHETAPNNHKSSHKKPDNAVYGVHGNAEKSLIKGIEVDTIFVAPGKTIKGDITPQGKYNVYHVVLAQPGKLSINVAKDDESSVSDIETYINILDANGARIDESGKLEFPYSKEVELKEAGNYFIGIKSSGTGAYNLTVQY